MSGAPKEPGSEEEIVVTPGGPRPKSLVHRVGPMEKVLVDETGQARVVAREGIPAEFRRSDPNVTAGLVSTPWGFRPLSRVHIVEKGQTVRVVNGVPHIVDLATNKFVEAAEPAVGPEALPDLGSGWITWAAWINDTGAPITSFRATWPVPYPPKTQKWQILYLFNGIETYPAKNGILQPVLQWGSTAAGGGEFWSVASWYVWSWTQWYCTNAIPVNVDDALIGAMTLEGQTGSTFSYNCEFQGIEGTDLHVQNIDELRDCRIALEAYYIQQCSDYPDQDITPFRGIDIETRGGQPPVTWGPVNRVTDCGQETVVVRDHSPTGGVDICYRRNYHDVKPPLESITEVQILFGVTQDGGGVAILPNGHVIHIPPRDPIFQSVTEGITEVACGLGRHEIAKRSTNPGERRAMELRSLEAAAKALEGMLQAVREALAKT